MLDDAGIAVERSAGAGRRGDDLAREPVCSDSAAATFSARIAPPVSSRLRVNASAWTCSPVRLTES
ncbi:hypothetical protein GQ85_30700 [Rhodococcus rhodochrous]|nr:hypothetical protein GQ85_30700 [Rhodococcus rhodochrous]